MSESVNVEILKIAQSIEEQRFYNLKNQWDEEQLKPSQARKLNEVPEFPSSENLLLEAKKLAEFVYGA